MFKGITKCAQGDAANSRPNQDWFPGLDDFRAGAASLLWALIDSTNVCSQ